MKSLIPQQVLPESLRTEASFIYITQAHFKTKSGTHLYTITFQIAGILQQWSHTQLLSTVSSVQDEAAEHYRTASTYFLL